MPLHESARPPRPDRADLRNEFWSAHADALLDRKTVAAGLNRSCGFLEQLATRGGGPAFFKAGTHRVLYRKSDVLSWFEGYAQRITSTPDRAAAKRGSRTSDGSPHNASAQAPARAIPDRTSPFAPTDAPEPEAA
jgi:hypothetical protein